MTDTVPGTSFYIKRGTGISCKALINYLLLPSVANQHRFDADLDPDPYYFVKDPRKLLNYFERKTNHFSKEFKVLIVKVS